jgi:serine/threonine-protein kinase
MGEVWAATSDPDEHGQRRNVAIKVLLARAAMKPDLVRRFEREAKIASAIHSPYVCQLIEVGQSDDGAHLLVFEQLSGESLADRLKREQYLPFSEVGPIIDDVLQGLVAAHEAGVVHRDLKPGNIFLEQRPEEDAAYAAPGSSDLPPGRRERAKILDFGISKVTRRDGEREPTLTAFDATLGSFAYMAPEQVRGAARADERADIYAVGAVAFRALSGRLPFEGTTAAVLVAMKLDRSAPSLAEITGDQWPAGLERFLERALERRRENRFATASEALAAWRSIQPSALASARMPERLECGPPRTPTLQDEDQPIVLVTPPAQKVSPKHAAAGAPRPPTTAIPPPTKPVVQVYQKATVPEVKAAPMAPPRPPAPSYQVIEDNPTEVDGPPEMTVDGSYSPEPYDNGKRRKTGRP